jgi:formylglycine-generating enzyme required for sulfatase activity
VAVPAGPFLQGSASGDDDERPPRTRTVPAFAIDRTEVTVGAFVECVRAGACRAPLDVPLSGDPRLPLERASWPDAAAYCRWRNGRLPTEAEWEKAARGIGRRLWPWGSQWLDGRANHGRAERMGPSSGGVARSGGEETLDETDGFRGLAPAGSFAGGESPYGVRDMAGNVWEWTSGYFGREPPQAGARFDPRGPAHGSERTIRGGGYRSPPSDLRVTRRAGLLPSERAPGVGFRCAYDLDASKRGPGERR